MLDEPAEIIRKDLGEGEKLLWSGRPQQGLMLRSVDWLLIPFSLMWGGFAIFWEFSVLTMGAEPFFAVWGVPFVVIGLYLIIGRFFVDAWQRSKTLYAVTSERIIIRSAAFGQRVKSLSLFSLPDISLIERGDGGGTIAFGPTSFMLSMQNPGAGWPSWGNVVPSFELDSNARQVFDCVRNAQRAQRMSGATT
jgi:hypothetical protein